MKNDGGNILIEEIKKSTDIKQVYEYLLTSVINEQNYLKLLKLMLDPDLKKIVETDTRLIMIKYEIDNLINSDSETKKIQKLKQFISYLKEEKEKEISSEPQLKKKKI